MRKVFTVLAAVLPAAAIVQFFLAGYSAIDPAPVEESFSIHRMIGYLIAMYSLLVIVAAAVARAPGRLIGLTALASLLAFMQIVISVVSGAIGGDTATVWSQLVFGLHAINGMVVIGVSMAAFQGARLLAAEPRHKEPADAASLDNSAS